MRKHVLIVLFLVVATLSVYMRAGGNGFVNYDDNRYVTANPHVATGITPGNVGWAFTTTTASNWHPLTWLSHMTDCQLYGLNPRWHHLTSVALHALNAVLLFLLLARMTHAPWRSAFVAALFALHPLHVESVAWVAERKDVLSTLFFLLTLLVYARYVERPGPARYVPVFCLYALGLMAKPMLVTLPCVLLLLDYWPLGRYRTANPARPVLPGDGDSRGKLVNGSSVGRLVLEKVPLFLLAAASGMITVYAQKSGEALASLEVVPYGLRISNAFVAYVAYIGKMFWPAGLSVIYPLPPGVPLWQVAGAVLLLSGISILAILLRGSAPFLLVGWLWYLGTLVPVIGLVQVGIQAFADRYSYIPLIGLFMCIAWAVPEAASAGRRQRALLAASAALVLVVFAAATWRQTGFWKDSRKLFTHALAVTSGNYMAHLNLGTALAEQGNLAEAMDHYDAALRINPNLAIAHFNLGNGLLAQGRRAEAVSQYRAALRINPSYASAHYNLGVVMAGEGMSAEAIEHFSEAVRIKPDFAKAHVAWGLALSREGRLAEAVSHYYEALRLKPDDAEARKNLEYALGELKRQR